MLPRSVLLPVFALMSLIFGLTIALARARVRAVTSGEVRMKDIALGRNWPDRIVQLSNSFRNQFELPLLFYVLVVFELISGMADLVFVVLEWAFVASRFAHAYIHVTSNHVVWRFRAFAAGFWLLLLMWAMFAMRVVVT